ncbi:hypothetical protein AC249_AIPGENE12286 [Exaiptasia diaphana]|nr:hypothetical protein AC249_AIPGENE7731 [Exaiptasia diaphana]KXJ20734.1 hypothetical protein AC249_AIPGENE12286 [Exaiptasia diaphana]
MKKAVLVLLCCLVFVAFAASRPENENLAKKLMQRIEDASNKMKLEKQPQQDEKRKDPGCRGGGNGNPANCPFKKK